MKRWIKNTPPRQPKTSIFNISTTVCARNIRAAATSSGKSKPCMRTRAVIASCLNNGEIDEAKEYLSVVLDNLNRVYSYIQTGNAVMNYIINSKLEYAQRSGIPFKAEIENLPFARMGSVDFAAVLSNALDNAIEASLSASERLIYLSVMKKRGYDTITVKNKTDKSVLDQNPDLISTKPDNQSHGFGVKQIKAIAEKYGGMVDVYEEEGMFCISIMIPSE